MQKFWAEALAPHFRGEQDLALEGETTETLVELGDLARSVDRMRDGLKDLIDNLDIFTLAESLGGVESLIAHPATMTHAAMTPEARVTAGITDGLLRLSVGLEHEDDIVTDLLQALDAVTLKAAA